MQCPLCKKSDTSVLDSRDEISFVRRRRECLSCSYRFTTYERTESPKFKVLKRNNIREEYCRPKLQKGIELALEKRPFSESQISDIVTEIEHDIIKLGKKEVNSKDIGNIVIKKLKAIDGVAYLRFLSVYKKFASADKFQKEAEKLNLDK
jgi:transcriptional repressor NrdR